MSCSGFHRYALYATFAAKTPAKTRTVFKRGALTGKERERNGKADKKGSYSISMISLPSGIGRGGARRAGAGITGPHSIDESPSSSFEESGDGAL